MYLSINLDFFFIKMWAIIPARGGSKGIPRKNVKIFKGKPLIVHTIEQALASDYVMRVIVTTDDNEIASVARSAGAEVPFMRPESISQDMSTDLEFMQHATQWFKDNEGQCPQAWLHLRPTYPLRKVKDIDSACKLWQEDEYDSLRSVVPTEHSVFKSYTVVDGKLNPIFTDLGNIREPFNMPRQMLPQSYQHNGCIDIVSVKTIEAGSMSGKNIRSFVMDASETYDLDTEQQFHAANYMGGLYDLLLSLNAVDPKNVEYIQTGVRGNPHTSVYKDRVSGVIWLNDVVPESHYETLTNYWNTSTLEKAREKCFNDDKRRFHMMKDMFSASTSLLDVGTGCGGFIKQAQTYFSKVEGVELQEQTRLCLLQDGLQVWSLIPDNREYSVVTLFHVLEHLTQPIDTLRQIRDALLDDGTLIVEVPHAGDALITKYDCEAFRKFTFWQEHLILHTKSSLTLLLNKAGFKVEKIENIQRYPLANHLYWLSDGKPGGHSKLDVSDSNQSYETYLKEKNYTDTIIAFAKKQ